jgi:hypothetical protein
MGFWDFRPDRINFWQDIFCILLGDFDEQMLMILWWLTHLQGFIISLFISFWHQCTDEMCENIIQSQA